MLCIADWLLTYVLFVIICDQMELAKTRNHGVNSRQTNGNAKLTDHEVDLLRRMYEDPEQGWTIYALAKKWEISRQHCTRLVRYEQR